MKKSQIVGLLILIVVPFVVLGSETSFVYAAGCYGFLGIMILGMVLLLEE